MFLFYSTGDENGKDPIKRFKFKTIKYNVFCLVEKVVLALITNNESLKGYSIGVLKIKMELMARDFYKALRPHIQNFVLAKSNMGTLPAYYFQKEKHGFLSEDRKKYLKKRYFVKFQQSEDLGLGLEEKETTSYYFWKTGINSYYIFLGIDKKKKNFVLCFLENPYKLICIKKTPVTQLIPGLFEKDPPEKKQEDNQEKDDQEDREEDDQEDKDQEEKEKNDQEEKNQEENQEENEEEKEKKKEEKKKIDQENNQEASKKKPSSVKRFIVIGIFLFFMGYLFIIGKE